MKNPPLIQNINDDFSLDKEKYRVEHSTAIKYSEEWFPDPRQIQRSSGTSALSMADHRGGPQPLILNIGDLLNEISAIL